MFDRLEYYKKNLTKEQFEVVKKFDVMLQSKGYQYTSLCSYCAGVVYLCKYIKDFNNITEEQLNPLFEDLLRLKSKTRTTKIGNVIRFFEWLKADKKIIDLVKEHKPKREGCTLERQDILSEEEIRDLINAEINPMWKAFFSTTYFCILRYKEVAGIKLKDVYYDADNNLFEIDILQSKTKSGLRKVYCIDNVEILKRWMDIHPFKHNKESYLFVNNKGKKISGYLALWRIKVISKKAGIKKRVYLHLLRHSSCTKNLADGVPSHILQKMGGWKDGAMLNYYGHLVSQDVKNYFIRNGNGKKKEEPLKKKVCWKCNAENSFDAMFCKCGVTLDRNAVFEAKEKRDKKDELIEVLLGDPQLVALAKQKVLQNKEAVEIIKQLA